MHLVIVFLLFLVNVAHGQSLDQTYIDYVNPMVYGTSCNSVALSSTLTAVGTQERTVYLTATDRTKTACTWSITGNVTIPTNVTLWIPFGVRANISGGVVVTVEGCLRVDDPNWYSGGGTVVENGSCVDSTNKLLPSILHSYVVSGCSHSTSPNTTTNIPSCEALISKQSPRLFLNVKHSINAQLNYNQGDGRYWLGLRANTGQLHTGWTCIDGTLYCFVKSDSKPVESDGLLILQRSTVAGGAITLVRRMFETNGFDPGSIHLTDRYIGMVCDGVTDESTKMQAAVNLSQESGGRMLVVPDGTCVFKNVVITRFEEDPGGIDNDDLRHGCTSIRGKGPGQSVFTAPDTASPEDFILQSSCTAFGGRQQEEPGFIAAPAPSGTVIENINFVGKRTRAVEYHGLVLEGTYPRLSNVNFHYINGHALWIGKNTKLESGWIENVHVRGSGRYVDDCGCSTGTATRNAAAVLFDKPTDTQRNNNIQVYGLQVGYSWYAGLSIDCTDGLNINLYFYGAMMHNHEATDDVKQGRLDSDAGLAMIRGTCHNILFDGFNFVSPGSDAPNTNDMAAPAVPALRIDAEGSAGKPGELIVSNSYFNSSESGKGIYVKESGRLILNNVNFRSDSWTRGQLEVEPLAFSVSDPTIAGYNRMFVCNVSTFAPAKTFIHYSDTNSIVDCNGRSYSAYLPSDSMLDGTEIGSWSFGATDTTINVAHGVSCPVVGQLQPADISINNISSQGSCTQKWITTCCANTFTLVCNAAPGVIANGTYSIDIPRECTSSKSGMTELTVQSLRTVFTTSKKLYLYDAKYTAYNPGVTGTATDYVDVYLVKRKISSSIDIAKVTNQSSTFAAWTPVTFTVIAYNELNLEPGESLAIRTDKIDTDGGSVNGVSLNEGVISVILGTVPAILP